MTRYGIEVVNNTVFNSRFHYTIYFFNLACKILNFI